MESQPLNPEFMINPENCHKCLCSLDTDKVIEGPDEIPQNATFHHAKTEMIFREGNLILV